MIRQFGELSDRNDRTAAPEDTLKNAVDEFLAMELEDVR